VRISLVGVVGGTGIEPVESLQGPPQAEQEVASVLGRVSVEAAPAFTELGAALNAAN
jgi:hypothetical protein